ncbi:MAG: hypothetical protein KDD66_08425 [Bdellovibrionales bacterium]|nr:hypothetical protein [Bdellovibrionales bacterium]
MGAGFAAIAGVVRDSGSINRTNFLELLGNCGTESSDDSALRALAEDCRETIREAQSPTADLVSLGATGAVFLSGALNKLASMLKGSRQSDAFQLVALKGEVEAAGSLMAEAYSAAVLQPSGEETRLQAEALVIAVGRCYEQLGRLAASLELSGGLKVTESGWIWDLVRSYSGLAAGRIGPENTSFITKYMGVI